MILYRLIATLALPVMAALVLVGRLRGRQPKGALAERLGFVPHHPEAVSAASPATAYDTAASPVTSSGKAASGMAASPTATSHPATSPATSAAPQLWLHGASNGELASARWLVARLVEECPGLAMLVTVNTPTARAMVAGWGLPGVVAALAPFDAGGAAARLLARWRPAALIVIENELWPARIAACARAGVPVAVIGARMSERSAARWVRHAAGLMRATLGRIGWLSAQDAGSEARLVALGLPRAALGPLMGLKGQGAASVAAEPPFPPPVPRPRCLLAASTHEGEDQIALDAFLAARAAGRFEHLILAPRHPRRAAAIAQLITARGLSMAQRSAGQAPGLGTAVHLADTMGEMDHWYRMAGVTLIGGTFADRGGHTPWEPVAQGSAVVRGPSIYNNAEAFAALDAAGGAVAVADAAALAPALIALDEAEQSRLAAAAQAALVPGGDGTDLVAALRGLAGI